MVSFSLRWIEREYVALCIAEHLVRGETEPITPARRAARMALVSLAETLQMREHVIALAQEALRRPR
jgi:hypothetical protein